MPQMICRTCSQGDGVHYCSRVVTTFEKGGKPLAEPIDQCQCCSSAPGGKVHSSTEDKLWLMQEVNPNEYETVAGEKKLKDWAQADIEQRMGKEDEDDLTAERDSVEAKRRHAREMKVIHPRGLTPHEIAIADEKMRELLMRERALDAGLMLPPR